MKLTNNLKVFAIAAGLAVPAFSASVAQAEVSANIGISNMYLWRGQNLTPDAPQVHGGIEFSNGEGLYGGLWTTNEDDGHETDLYIGYGGEAGDISYDVSYWHYLYPEDGLAGEGPTTPTNVGLGDNSLSELVIGLGYQDFGLTLYNSVEAQDGSDWLYYTIDYTAGKYNILYGAWTYSDAGNNEYSHVTVSYSYDDNLSLAVSVAQEDVTDGVETDPLFQVSYNIPLGK